MGSDISQVNDEQEADLSPLRVEEDRVREPGGYVPQSVFDFYWLVTDLPFPTLPVVGVGSMHGIGYPDPVWNLLLAVQGVQDLLLGKVARALRQFCKVKLFHLVFVTCFSKKICGKFVKTECVDGC